MPEIEKLNEIAREWPSYNPEYAFDPNNNVFVLGLLPTELLPAIEFEGAPFGRTPDGKNLVVVLPTVFAAMLEFKADADSRKEQTAEIVKIINEIFAKQVEWVDWTWEMLTEHTKFFLMLLMEGEGSVTRGAMECLKKLNEAATAGANSADSGSVH